MNPLLAGERLTLRLGGATLVREVDVAVEAGRLTAVVGPNGAGKSTLVKLLSGEVRPSAGAVLYGGENVHAIPPWRLACLRAVLPQASRLAFPFTVREVARIGIDGIGQGLTARDRDRILADALARADVAPLAGRSYQSLSGGEQQRTQFARVLAQLAAGRSVAREQVLLLDEPTASLDLRHQIALLETATALARDGTAVLAVLHDLNLAAAYADEILVMSAGGVAARGVPAAAIDDQVLAEVFGVALRVGVVPAGRQPFVLPAGRTEEGGPGR